ncbi:MAG: tetratricopeptide repeat protein [Polyangiaceae bacterium]|nr:tetratricopeptide repeat protein [Polyangiaceae bacterium]
MDLAQRLTILESVHDWHTLVDELEKAIASETDATRKASLFLKLGQILEERFLNGVKALKHFQEAYKLNPALLEALEHARGVYWELGKAPMVQKLLDIELRSIEGQASVPLLIELGDVLSDAGDHERAMATYAKALAASDGQSDAARGGLTDEQLEPDSWTPYVSDLLAQAQQEQGSEASRTFLRAARIARRFESPEYEALLAKAYEAHPLERQVAAAYEGLLVGSERAAHLEAIQTDYAESLTQRGKAQVSFRFGARWATRHQNLETGAKFLESTLAVDPHRDAALSFLKDLWGTKEGNWDRVLGVAEKAAGANNPSPFAVAQAGLVAWRQLGNLMRARSWFEKLAELAPDHPSVHAFEVQIGESLTGGPSAAGEAALTSEQGVDVLISEPPAAAQAEPEPLDAAEEVSAPEPPPPASVEEPPAAVSEPEPSAPEPISAESSAPEAVVAEAAPVSAPAPVSVPTPASAPSSAPTSAPAEKAAGADPARITEIRQKLEKLQAAKRMTEYVKTLVELAEAVPDPDEKVALYLEAAELYTTKFPNAAEAVKCFEAVLNLDENNQLAIDHLRATYEKRRDWEKLIGLMKREAAALPYGHERSAKFLEIAKLANERVKKPDVCIELWSEVLENDSENAEALAALAGLYERSKEWDKLANILERQSEVAHDASTQEAIYKKLGQLYGDRLSDDQKAVDAWRKLLALNPNDRTAQEALKKKYLALGMWDDLEVFYAESGKWDEFIRLLETQESKETDENAKISLLVKTAQLWVTQKGKLDRAARAYEKVLTIDATHLGAAEALIPIYQQSNNPKGLAAAIEVKLKHDVDGEERLALLREVAGLYETKLKDPERAFERYLAAFELAPTDERCVEDVERAARVTGGWEALIASYNRTIENAESTHDVELAIVLRLRLGRVLVDEVGRIDQALEQFRAVYDRDGENEEAILALERLYRQTNRHQELLGIYEKKRDLATDPEDRRGILFQIARLYEMELGSPRKSIETYRQVLEENERDPEALVALDRLYRQENDWEPYVEILRARIELDNPEEALVDLKYRLGSTLEKHLGDPAGALENYREILFIDQGNDAARVALENLLENKDLRAETASILQEIYETQGDWPKLVGALEILAESEADSGRRVGLLRKVGRVAAENLEDLPKAIDALSRALREDPTSGETLAELEQLAGQAGAWDKLEEILSEIAENLGDPLLARAYWMRLAAIDERLGKVDAAAQRYLKVLGIDPADQEALAAMDALYRRTERWDDLVGVYRRRIDLAEDTPAREALYGQMATVQEQKLGRPEDAIASYRNVLSLEPTSNVALTALDGLFSRQAMWDELAENLEAQLQLAESEEAQTDLMLRLGDLRETRMNQVETAIDIYREVLEREPENAPALAALERLGKTSQHELAISEILEPLYRQAGDWQKLVGVYEVQVRRSDDPNRRVELLHQIATLYEDAGGDADSAFNTLARALAEDPTSEETKQGLDRLARATDRYADLAKVFEDRAAAQLVGAGNEDAEATTVSDPAVAVDLFTMAARVYENDLGAAEPAIAHYRKVLEIDQHNLPAAEALERIFRASERYAELSEVLQQKADILDGLPEKKASLFQAASIEEDVLDRHEAAVRVYRKILELDPEDVRAIDALIKLYLAHSRWADLLAVYVSKADLVQDVDEKKNIYYQVGAVYERELNDVPQAIDTYNRVLEIDPADLQALSRLDVLYQMAENWPELLTVLQNEAELASDAAESISYQYRIAELYEKRLDDLARAIELYRDLLQQMPDHAPTIAALEGIKSGPREALAASLVLEPIYDATGEWKRLVSVLEVQVQHAEDAFAKVDLLHRIARLEEEMLGDHNAAFDVYARAVALDVTNEESLGSLERLASAVNRWPEVASLYDRQLERLRSEQPERFVELGLRLAQIFETQLEDVDSAIARYRAVLEVDAENWQAISSLDRLLVMTERWRDLVSVLAREADIGQTPDDILNFKYRLGQVHQNKLNDLPAAIGSYREVLAAAPEHVETLEALEQLFASGVHQLEIGEILEPLYQSTGEWDKLGNVLEAELTHKKEREERLAMYYRIAELHEDKLISLDGALGVYVRALKEYPSDEKTLEDCERLAGSCDGGWETLANAYADVLELHNDKAVQASIGKRLARVFEEELGDISNAERTYRYVLGVEALDVEALTQLDRIYTSLEQWQELAQVLEQRILATKDTIELVELHLRLGEVYETKLVDEAGVGQLDDATRVFRRVFDELDPPNEAAILALERIYGQRGQWPELKVVLERQLEHAGGDSEESEIRAKMANLLADRLGDMPRAVETWKRVLDLRGDDPEALHGLANLYERLGQWAELSDVLGRHFDIASEDEERVAVLLRRARLFEGQLQRDDSALEDYQRMLDIQYDNVDALYAISAIWRRRNDSQQLVESLHQTVDRAGEKLAPEQNVALFRELATTYQNVLGQPYEAIDAWRRLLAVDPRDFSAMSNLEGLLRAEERWEEVIEVKMGRARALPDEAEQIREYLEVAALWEQRVGEPDKGTPAYEAILQIEPAHDQAFFALEKLHSTAKRAEPLIELYLARLDTRDDVHEKTDILRKVARVFEEELEDRPQAFDALVTAFEMDVFDSETTKYLERITHATSKWPELMPVVNGWLQSESDPRRKIQLCLRLAKWYAEDLNREDYAMPYYQQVHKLDPNNVNALRQMANLQRKMGKFKEEGYLLQQALANAVTESDRKEIQTEIGQVLHLKMNDPEQGIVFYRKALEVDPHFVPALEQLERIYTERGQNGELVEVLNAKARGLTDAEQIAGTKLRSGGLYETSLNQPDRAGQVYREVLEVDAGNLLAMRGLERVYQQLQQWTELVSILEMQLDVVATERDRIEVLMKIARIQEELFVKPDAAAARLEQVVEIDPNFELAYEGLARCYRQRRQWHDLIQTYDRHVNATVDRQKKIDLWIAMAIVFADELEDVEKAIDAYLNVVDTDPQHIPALDALAKLYEKQGESSRAIDYMTRVAELTTDGKQKVEMYYRIGRQLDEKLGDRMAAQDNYERALDLDPAHQPTLAALRAIAIDAADWDRAARYIESEQLVTESPRVRAKLLVELGKMRDEMLGEHDLAIQSYELALQSDADNEDAALPLVNEYVSKEQWGRAEPLAEMLVKKSGKRERTEQHMLQNLFGKILAAQKNWQGALKAYQTANQLDLTDQETIRGLAEVCFNLQDWPGALTNFQKVLTALEEHDTEQRAYVYFKLGGIKQAQGQPKQAINNFEKALQVDPSHRPTLEAMVAIYDQARDWPQVCHYKRIILDNVYDGEERYKMLVDIGDIWGDPARGKAAIKAIEAYDEALELKPTDHVLLHKLLQVCQSAQQWERMNDTLQRIADLEQSPERRSKYFFTMAQIFRDHVQDQDRAVDYFNQALDLNPGYLEAFERINKILTAQKDWKQLERAYRKMLHRLVNFQRDDIGNQKKSDVLFNLWHALGLIYRDRMQEKEKAVEAFKFASGLRPADVTEHLILSELYEETEQLEQAASEYQSILKIDPMRVDPYRKLYDIYLRKQTYDEAWCLASALAFLGKAGDEEREFYDSYKPSGLPQVRARVDNDSWLRLLFHEEESLYVGKIFEFIAPAALRAKLDQMKQKNELPVLDARFRQDPATSTVTFARTFGWAVNVLGLPMPQLYVRSDVPGALSYVPVEPYSSLAGQTVLSGFSPQELLFIVGKHAAYYRGEHLIRAHFPTVTELTVLFFAGIKLVAGDQPVPPELSNQVIHTAQSLGRYMQPIHVEGLKMAVRKFIQDEEAKANIKRWSQTVELTSTRAGFLLSGDLEVAKKIIAAEPQLPGDLTPQEKLKELLVFAVSENYFKLRKQLGLDIKVAAQ